MTEETNKPKSAMSQLESDQKDFIKRLGEKPEDVIGEFTIAWTSLEDKGWGILETGSASNRTWEIQFPLTEGFECIEFKAHCRDFVISSYMSMQSSHANYAGIFYAANNHYKLLKTKELKEE